jgi:hypothetical protein
MRWLDSARRSFGRRSVTLGNGAIPEGRVAWPDLLFDSALFDSALDVGPRRA